jgi:hypothetical protein
MFHVFPNQPKLEYFLTAPESVKAKRCRFATRADFSLPACRSLHVSDHAGSTKC